MRRMPAADCSDCLRRFLCLLFVHLAVIAVCLSASVLPGDYKTLGNYSAEKESQLKSENRGHLELTEHLRSGPSKRDVNGQTNQRTASPPPPSSPPASSSSSSASSARSSGAATTAPASASASPTVPQCPVSCQGIKQRPVCASDGVTYSSKCELRRYRECGEQKKRELRVVSKGRCRDETKCQEERRMARYELLQRPGQDIYIPECRVDGSYLETQCHNGTGYCWCVRSDGKPIPGSSVEGHATNCKKIGPGKKSQQTSIASKHRRGVGGCSPHGRSTFNQNLIRRFNEEYTRAPKQGLLTTASLSQASGGSKVAGQCAGDGASSESCAHRRVIEWKFSELDVDKDMELKRKELKTLRYLVNKIVEPHACALTFLEYCDWDNNKRIGLNEWTKCLRILHPATNTVNNGGQNLANSKKLGGVGATAPAVMTTESDRQGDRQQSIGRVKPGSVQRPLRVGNKAVSLSQKKLQSRIHLKPLKATFYDLKSRTKETQAIGNTRNKVPESEQRSAPQFGRGGPSDAPFRIQPCSDERQKAKEMDRADPDGHIFIPECELNGFFKKAQCHNSTGYCWCVDEKTGMPIPGISTHNVTPDCSDVKANSLKGCPFLTKKRFLDELLDHITQEMVDRANNGTSSVSQLNEPDPSQSIEERAVRWKLLTMDSNHNGILEKGEVKNFREEIKLLKGEEKYMRKCRRNFLQYCDEDNDSKITLKEWVNCLGLNDQQQKNLPENPKRIGKNPFSTVLKS